MKKHYLLGIALAASFVVKSQTIIDFESTALVADSFDNGADLSGGFTYSNVHFVNVYDTAYNFNTGFAVSNKTDITTAGYTNQFSASTGSGYNSTNYTTFYQTGEIDMYPASPKQAVSARITNTTFAALSMLNGDFAGKVFGDSLNAAGVNDSTGGEDFFILNIYGRTYTGDTLGMVEVVLADYRFADNSQDFIVDSWLDVDLTPINGGQFPDYISFEFLSSDVGQWGINTPTYFALDDFEFQSFAGLEEVESNISMYPNPIQNQLNIENATGRVQITDGMGKLVYVDEINGTKKVNTTLWKAGVYFITMTNENGSVTKKVIK